MLLALLPLWKGHLTSVSKCLYLKQRCSDCFSSLGQLCHHIYDFQLGNFSVVLHFSYSSFHVKCLSIFFQNLPTYSAAFGEKSGWILSLGNCCQIQSCVLASLKVGKREERSWEKHEKACGIDKGTEKQQQVLYNMFWHQPRQYLHQALESLDAFLSAV